MSSEAGNLHEIQPSNEFNIKKLLSQATSKGRVNQEYEIYNQSRHRKLYSFVRESITVGCIGNEILSKMNVKSSILLFYQMNMEAELEVK